MDLEAHAVAGAVAEVVAVAARGDDAAAGGVDVVAAVGAAAHGRESGHLGGVDQGVHLAQLRRRLTGCERTSDVAAVTVDSRACVDDDELPGSDDPVARECVAVGCVIACGDDCRKGLSLSTQPAEGALQRPSHFSLGAARESLERDRPKSLVGDRRGTPYLLDLVLRP